MEVRDNIYLMTDRLNAEPVIYIGMSNRELKCSCIFAMLLWMPISVLIGVFIGYGLIGLGIGFMLAAGTVWLIGQRFRRLKRNKPGNHHMLTIRAWFEDKGLVRKTMVRRSDCWDIQRTNQINRQKKTVVDALQR
jgi:conjugative transfer region protein (TIGR03750 family)